MTSNTPRRHPSARMRNYVMHMMTGVFCPRCETELRPVDWIEYEGALRLICPGRPDRECGREVMSAEAVG